MVSLCLIVRDAERTLPTLLGSVEGAFDEIVAVDTGSTDGTVALIEAWAERTGTPCRLAHFEWVDDFSAARNYADSLASGDWLCWADADDEIRGAKRLRSLANRAPDRILGFYFDYDHPDDNGEYGFRQFRERLVRRGAGTWIFPVHEAKRINGDMNVAHPKRGHPFAAYRGPDVAEWVHRHQAGRTPTYARNLRIAEKWAAEQPDNPDALYCIALEHIGYSEHLDIDAALHYLRRYLTVQPEWTDQRCEVSRYVQKLLICKAMHGDTPRLTEASAMAHESIRERPDWTDSYLTLAQVADARGDVEQAKHWARRVIAMGQPKTLVPTDPRDYGERPQAILDGVRIVEDWWQLDQHEEVIS